MAIALNLMLPILFYFLFVFIDFLSNGSGAQSVIIYENNKLLWISVYLILAFIQNGLIFKYMDISSRYKYFLLASISIIYLYLVYKYF